MKFKSLFGIAIAPLFIDRGATRLFPQRMVAMVEEIKVTLSYLTKVSYYPAILECITGITYK